MRRSDLVEAQCLELSGLLKKRKGQSLRLVLVEAFSFCEAWSLQVALPQILRRGKRVSQHAAVRNALTEAIGISTVFAGFVLLKGFLMKCKVIA